MPAETMDIMVDATAGGLLVRSVAAKFKGVLHRRVRPAWNAMCTSGSKERKGSTFWRKRLVVISQCVGEPMRVKNRDRGRYEENTRRKGIILVWTCCANGVDNDLLPGGLTDRIGSCLYRRES